MFTSPRSYKGLHLFLENNYDQAIITVKQALHYQSFGQLFCVEHQTSKRLAYNEFFGRKSTAILFDIDFKFKKKLNKKNIFL